MTSRAQQHHVAPARDDAASWASPARVPRLALLLLLPLFLAGCNALYCITITPLCNLGVSEPPKYATTAFQGTWQNETPHDQHLSQLLVFLDEERYTKIKGWIHCDAGECEYDESWAIGYPWDRTLPLDANLWPLDHSLHGISVSLHEPTGNRMTVIAHYLGTDEVITHTFARQP